MRKRTISLLLTLCMAVTLFAGLGASASAESNVESVFDSAFYVAADPGAGLERSVKVDYDLGGSTGTLYLPGAADASQLCFSWDDEGLTVSRDGKVYESGTAPVAAAGKSLTYKVTKGAALALVTVKTVQGSANVSAMFLELDESKGTIKAMNGDPEHETQCFGAVYLDGEEYPYMSMKGRGNSTWILPKKPYNLTFYKKADYDKKQKVELIEGVGAKKWSLLANYFDNSLLRNKIALDTANALGIGLESRFVDLWMNGEYLGNYLMCPKNDYQAPDGGYALENDNYLSTDDPQFDIPGMFAVADKLGNDGFYNKITVKDIGDDAVEAGVDAAAIEAWFTEAWTALMDQSSEDYQKYFDLDSWAKMYLMYEVTKTYDCASGSLLMHRDGLTENDKLIAGPAWDYDGSFGRSLHKFLLGITVPTQMSAEGWMVDGIGLVCDDTPVSILQELGKHASFMQAVSEVFNENKAVFTDIVPNIERQSQLLRVSAAMDGELWGVNHLGFYAIAFPVPIGTGKYAFHYEITLTWQDYVNNMKTYAEKRVQWLGDHLFAEAPVGSITGETTVEIGCPITLTADANADSYQWQMSKNGKKWSDMEGANGSVLSLTADESLNGKQIRCIVRNSGVSICTTKGGSVPASAKTVLEPVTVSVRAHEHSFVNGFCACGEKDPGAEFEKVKTPCELRNAKLYLSLGGKELGEYSFIAYRNAWAIRCPDGSFLAADGRSLVYSDTAFLWNYENGSFSASVQCSYTAIGRLLGIKHSETVYLSADGNGLCVSKTPAAAGFAFLDERMKTA